MDPDRDCGCRPPNYFCSARHEQYHTKQQALRNTMAGPDNPALHMNRRERRARGLRGPVIPREVTRRVADETGLTPQQVTQAALEDARSRRRG